MNMIVGVPRETFPGERRVALTPNVVPSLVKKNISVLIESGAGLEAGITDDEFSAKGAQIVNSRNNLFAKADVILEVRSAAAAVGATVSDYPLLRKGQVVIAHADPLSGNRELAKFAATGATLFALELIPRITRAQSMDVLSSQATIAGYKAVLLAADRLPRIFPMLITAAGTITAAKVFIIGAGVAGLQAISCARRLGAVVQSYDVRPAVKEQVQSLGAKFVELPLESGSSQDAGGYAKAMDEEFYKRQRELLAKVVAASDVVITTAAIPGKKAPILVTRDMVEGMAPGSVVVDIAAERGGNCEVTKPGEDVVINGVSVMGPLNLSSTVPYHASQMYAKNVVTFLLAMVADGKLNIDRDDEIIKETLVCEDGKIVNPRIQEILAQSKA